MKTYDVLKSRKFVKEYDKNYAIPQDLLESMLRKTWEVTPSKNNFMAYNVYVVGPNDQDIKEKVYLNCLSNESKNDDNLNILEERYQDNPPNYANIKNCSHLIIFTMRLETQPSPFQKMLIDRGHNYEAVDENKLKRLEPLVSFEAGLFADTLSALCLENNIDNCFIGCFRSDLGTWKDIPFVKRKPVMIMTLGKAKKYLRKSSSLPDPRPDFERIVNFV